MASITLTTKEFNELEAKAELYDQLMDCIVEAYKVEVAPSSSWRPVSIDFKPEWPKDIVGRIVQSVGKKLSESAEAMDYLVKNEECVLDLEERRVDSLSYSERLYYGQYNLLECSEEFSTEYKGRKIAAELEAVEETEEEDE
jgi:hypothetical protein